MSTCNEREPLHKVAVLRLSLFSIIGLGNFYSGHYFDGTFEFVEGVITVFLVIMWPQQLCKLPEHLKNIISVNMMILLILWNTVQVIHMYCSKSFNPYFVILIFSIIFTIFLQCKYRFQCRTFSMIVAVLITVLNTASNLFMFEFDFKLDGYGCPFTLDHQAVN